MVLGAYSPGTLCWAKLKGYPWWPSRIEDASTLSSEVMDSKPRSGRVYPVLFFGSLDYAWMTPENLKPYEENLTRYGSKAKDRKDPLFSNALEQARDPSIAEELIRRNAAAAAAAASDSEDDDDEEEEEEEEDEDEAEGKTGSRDAESDVEMRAADSDSGRGRAPRRPQAKNGRTRKAPAGNKRMSLSSNSSGDEAAPETTPKRSRTAARDQTASKSGSPGSNARQDSEDTRSAARGSPRSASPEHGADARPGAAKDDDRKGARGATKTHQNIKNGSKTYQFLMQLRHKLQKTVIKGPVPEDLAPVNDVLRRLEDFDMTLELIQETKLGKVMRIIAGSERLKDAPEEQYDIKGRAGRLAEKWRQLILKLREGSAEHTAPESPAGKTPVATDGAASADGAAEAAPAAAADGAS
ncbi:hypothetical protein H4R18_004613 [Coemansia javaensis]|uniref:PWWP domain-containing protein n=1 Tax=Coemansia javaensis TaxID=2761396 RepID=A0A9W8H5N7_9FUNG|nr:hypothetical protein H4R18_004613 [Coemansia javaensis]